MAKFTPSFSGIKGRALFSLLFAAPMIHATDTATTKDGETITVTADANTATEATDGYQPLSTSTRSVAALKLRGSTVRRPLVMMEPSRLAPNPRRTKAS